MTAPGGPRRGGARGEELQVPPADFRSYYGRPVLKAPTWRHDIPAYLFTGGLAAGSSLMAAGADARGLDDLRRAGRTTSLLALGASTYFLVNDLGRPERFLNMLRVVKPTSPMSMGTWILAAFGPAAGLAAAAEAAPLLPERGPLGAVRRVLPGAGRVAGWSAAALAPALATYTAVLLADTSVPAWNAARRVLQFVFGGSALAAGAGAGLLGAPPSQTAAVRRMALAGVAAELVAERAVETRLGLASEAYHEPGPHRLLRASRVLSLTGVAVAYLGRRSRAVSGVAGLALLAGSVATRLGVYEGGVVSAKDPRYTVVPQRERLSEGRPARG